MLNNRTHGLFDKASETRGFLVILTFLIQFFFFIFIFAAFTMTALDRTALRDFAKLIAARINSFFYKERISFHFQYRVNYLVYLVF